MKNSCSADWAHHTNNQKYVHFYFHHVLHNLVVSSIHLYSRLSKSRILLASKSTVRPACPGLGQWKFLAGPKNSGFTDGPSLSTDAPTSPFRDGSQVSDETYRGPFEALRGPCSISSYMV